MMFDDFHFLRPWWFLGLIPLVAILMGCYRRQKQQGGWAAVCDPHLLPHLIIGSPGTSLTTPLMLAGCGWVLTITALAGPVWSKLPQSVYRDHSALVLVLDLSQSMNAQDIRPSRVERAKFKILDILNARREGLTGLVVFAKESFLVSPLTDDANTIAALVPALTTQLMPAQGSRVEQALHEANRLFDQSGITSGQILVLTDGAPSLPDADFLNSMQQTGRTLSVLGVGTPEGAPIPMEGGGFLQDRSGSIIIPTRDDSLLQTMAESGGGIYVPMTADNHDIQMLLTHLDRQSPDQTVKAKTRTTEQWKEEGPWIVLAVLLCAIPAFRRGWLGAALLLMILPSGAHAFTWEELWLRSDQRGAQLLQNNQPVEAARTFHDPAWKGVAHYQAGEYAQAAEAFKQVDTADGRFNLGNALARSGKLQEALEAYQSALTKDPQHEDAKFNAKLIQDLLDQEKSRHQENGTNQEHQPDAESRSNTPPNKNQPSSSNQSSSSNEQKDSAPRTQSTESPRVSSTQQSDANNSQSAVPHDDPAPDNFADRNQQQPVDQPNTDQETSSKKQRQRLTEAETNREDSSRSMMTAQSDQSQNIRGEQETQQTLEQWLHRIPDDPGGLLRRKFYLEHLKRQRQFQGSPTSRTGEQEW